MNVADDPEFSRTTRVPRPSEQPIGVHVLSESVFCPRAGVIASESGPDLGDEEPTLGPRLDPFVDYDEHRFIEELRLAYAQLFRWLTWLAPATSMVIVACLLHQPFWGVLLSFPAVVLMAQCFDIIRNIIALIRERSRYRSAPAVEIEWPPTQVTFLSWWSLRKAGFECIRPEENLSTPDGSLVGKPWRILRKGNVLGAPVIRRQKGHRDWHDQHRVRVAAYCELIEKSEGGQFPFGVILFAGTSDCVLVPNSTSLQRQKRQAMESVNRLRAMQMLDTFEPHGNRI